MAKKNPEKDVNNLLNQLNQDLESFIERFIRSSTDIESWGTLSNGLKFKDNEDCEEHELSCSVSNKQITSLYKNIDSIIHHIKNKSAELRELAIKDSLTGLYNRHFFNEVIEREVARGERNSEVVSFIMIDLDKLKQINDGLGHLTGDKMLVEASNLIKNTVRKSDMVFRFGGDEFLVLMVNSDCGMTNYMIKRLIDACGKWNNDNEKEYGCRLSFSIGCSTCYKCDDILEALNEADARMYKNKKEKKETEMRLKQSINHN